MQTVSIGQSASLGVLKFMKGQSLERFSFNWSKVGIDDTQPPADDCKLNMLTFRSVREEDLGYYQCEVKEAGKVVLTVYRALYEGELSKFSTYMCRPSASLLLTNYLRIIIITNAEFFTLHPSSVSESLLGEYSGAAGQKRRLSAGETSSAKHTRSISPQGVLLGALHDY